MEILDKPDPMNVWIGSSHNPVHERSETDWWCTPVAAAAGDLILMYEKGAGIKRVERIKSVRSTLRGVEKACEVRGMKTVDTLLVLNLRTAISYHEFLRHPFLRNLPSVKRKFQGTCLRVPPAMWPELKVLVEEHT